MKSVVDKLSSDRKQQVEIMSHAFISLFVDILKTSIPIALHA